MPYFSVHNLGPKPYLPIEERVIDDRKPIFPAVNIFKFDDKYTVEIALPGFKKKELKIEVKEDNILIEGHHESHPKKGRTVQQDFRVQEFRRVIRLDNLIDRKNITAEFSDGVLVVNLPKINESLESKARVIAIE